MKLKRVEISEDERAKLLAQHQQRVERYREEIERAASGQTAGAKFVDWQNPEWDVLESQAKSTDEGDGGFPAGELPQGWSIEPIGATVKFIVSASAADGDFELTDSEALSAGVRLIQLCAIARSVRSAMEGAGSASHTDPGGERWTVPEGFTSRVAGSNVMLVAPASASDSAHQLSADGAEALADLIHSAVAVASVRELRSPEWDASLSRIEQATAAERASDQEASSDDEDVAALARVRRDAAVAQDCR